MCRLAGKAAGGRCRRAEGGRRKCVSVGVCEHVGGRGKGPKGTEGIKGAEGSEMITAASLREAELRDRGMFRERQLKGIGRFGKTGRLVRQISTEAVMNAVNTEGREVLTREAEGYWRDQDRRYFGVIETPAGGVRVMRNRLGRVSWRKVYG